MRASSCLNTGAGSHFLKQVVAVRSPSQVLQRCAYPQSLRRRRTVVFGVATDFFEM